MRTLLLTFLFICLFFSFSYAQENLEVDGNIKSTSLVNPETRVIQANENGVLLTIPNGNEGELLTQTTQGATWLPANESTTISGTNCMLHHVQQ